MSVVLQFPAPKYKGTQPKPSDKVKLYCKGCCDDRFHIHDDGTATCYHCGAFMLNLKFVLLR